MLLGYGIIAVALIVLAKLNDNRTPEQKQIDYENDLKEREIEANKELADQLYRNRTSW